MSTDDNRKLIEQIYSDSMQRSGTTFMDALAEDATWTVTGQYSWSRTFLGRDAILNGLMGHVRSLLTDRTRTVPRNIIAEGEFVVVEGKGDNVTKAGLRYDNDYCIVWTVRGGKVVAIREYCDSVLTERTLGPFPQDKVAAIA